MFFVIVFRHTASQEVAKANNRIPISSFGIDLTGLPYALAVSDHWTQRSMLRNDLYRCSKQPDGSTEGTTIWVCGDPEFGSGQPLVRFRRT
jgi:hypothetical protein